jgi:ribosomal protein S17E
LNSLLATRDYESALKVDYMLFFTNPFQHNTQLIAALAQISSLLG